MRKYITIPFEDYSRMSNHKQSRTIMSKLTEDNDTFAAVADDATDTTTTAGSAAAAGSTGAREENRRSPPTPSLTAEPTVNGVVRLVDAAPDVAYSHPSRHQVSQLTSDAAAAAATSDEG